MSTSSPISARFAGPEILQKGSANTISCPLYRDGALVVATGGNVAILRADGTQAVSASVSIAANIATYTTPTFSSEALGENWRIVWTITWSGGSGVFDRMAALCRRRLFPVVTDADLLRRHSDLNNIKPPDVASFQDYLDEAWVELLHTLRQKGNFPQLILSPEDLRYVHLFRTLEAIFNDFTVRSGQGEKWPALAADYRSKAKEAFNSLSLVYSSADDGLPDSRRRPAQSVTFLAAGGDWWTNGR